MARPRRRLVGRQRQGGDVEEEQQVLVLGRRRIAPADVDFGDQVFSVPAMGASPSEMAPLDVSADWRFCCSARSARSRQPSAIWTRSCLLRSLVTYWVNRRHSPARRRYSSESFMLASMRHCRWQTPYGGVGSPVVMVHRLLSRSCGPVAGGAHRPLSLYRRVSQAPGRDCSCARSALTRRALWPLTRALRAAGHLRPRAAAVLRRSGRTPWSRRRGARSEEHT